MPKFAVGAYAVILDIMYEIYYYHLCVTVFLKDGGL